jgi:hypothetical protein
MSTNENKLVSSKEAEEENTSKTTNNQKEVKNSILISADEMENQSQPQLNTSTNQCKPNNSNNNNNNINNNKYQKKSKDKLHDYYQLHDVYVPNYSHPSLKYPNTYLDPNSLSLVAKQYLSQLNASNQSLSHLNPNLVQASTIRSSQDPVPSNNKKNSNRNSSCNPAYNKSNQYKSTHEFVTLEFSSPNINGMPPKYMSRERKPLAIVNPVTKQVLNASQINSTRSSSISTSLSSPIDLKFIQSNQAPGFQPQINKASYQSSPHIGRRDLNKTNNIQNLHKQTTDNSASTYKTSN